MLRDDLPRAKELNDRLAGIERAIAALPASGGLIDLKVWGRLCGQPDHEVRVPETVAEALLWKLRQETADQLSSLGVDAR